MFWISKGTLLNQCTILKAKVFNYCARLVERMGGKCQYVSCGEGMHQGSQEHTYALILW